MSDPVFLSEARPLLFKVADWLAELASAQRQNLRRYAVVVPTAGAGRRLTEALSATGSAAPLTVTPMGLLALAAPKGVATESDSLLAWTSVLSRASREKYPSLLENFTDLKKSALRIAQSLRGVCSMLAEAGLAPGSGAILQACGQEEDRWREIESLYRRYLRLLEEVDLQDPNEAHLAVANEGRLPAGVERIIVAGVPDLSLLVQQYLQKVAASGVPVHILVDAPDCDDDRFDAWGRPDPETWAQRILAVRQEDVSVAADPFSEAEILAGFVQGSPRIGVCAADPEALSFQKRALRKRGFAPYDPSGKPLLQCECATLAVLWLSFCHSGQMEELRSLAEHPAFLRATCARSGLGPSQVLAMIDDIRTRQVMDSLTDARIYFHSGEGAALLGVFEEWRSEFDTSRSLEKLPAFLKMLYAGRESVDAPALDALDELLQSVLGSPLSRRGSAEEIFRAALERIAIPEPHQKNEVELNGWLEALWMAPAELVIAGCTEGSLPSHVSSHPFLPDSACTALGLQNNAQRYARDIYLLHCLLAARAAGKVQLLFSRAGADGEPAKPSRVLFRCADGELPARVKKFFGPPASLRSSPARQPAWMIHAPQISPPVSLRVTGFGEYLRCPLRFYFKQLLRMAPFDARKVEMDAVDFGILLHKVVENFANNESLRDSDSDSVIEKFVLAELDDVIAERFGRRLALPVRVQRESLRARLRQFARIQAEERRAGWRIQQGEFRFEKEGTMSLGGLLVTASLDRVEVHERTGQRRILDYKTFAQAKAPADTHWGVSDGEFAEAEFLFDNKAVRWQELQLPLYRALASFRWPDDPAPPQVGYFLLPERIEESAIVEFDLQDEAYESAIRCAGAVADRIRRGVFWPPREVMYDDFESIFLGEDPALCLDESSITFLQGK